MQKVCPSASKLTTRDHLIKEITQLKSQKKRVGFTSGVFDLLHVGHVSYLELARKECDFLVVGVNSDLSVSELKGDRRPIVPAQDRATTLAALQCVDRVFIFDESNNNRNIELLTPDLYLKAGDYSADKLSSTPIVESYGGHVVIIPFKDSHSTTSIIERICARYGQDYGQVPDTSAQQSRPAIFVDRDGTIIEHVEYLHEPEKVKIIPGALEALASLRASGHAIVMVTNQPGIGLGYFTKEQFFATNSAILRAASKVGLKFDKIYFCPHSDADLCSCRKPGRAMIDRAVKELNINLPGSIVVGDMSSDLELARRCEIKSVLVKTGKGGSDGRFKVNPDVSLDSLAELPQAVAVQGSEAAKAIFDSGQMDIRESGEFGDRSRLLEAIGLVGAKLGHDLNNLMGAVKCATELMQLKISKSSGELGWLKESIAIIDSSVDKTLTLAQRIRGFVRPGEIYLEELKIKELLERVLGALRYETDGRADVLLNVSDPDLKFKGNEFQLSQVFAGIVLNAVQACQKFDDAVVVIQVDLCTRDDTQLIGDGRFIRVAIIDHGAGLGSKTGERVFEPLATRDERAGIGEGLGLTLAMAQEVVARHGGKITIQSAAQRGTRVNIYVPVVRPPLT